MAELTLRAERRSVLGKQVRQLRREGRLPGIVYGPAVTETVPVTVDTREFDRFYRSTGHSTLFALNWDGGTHSVFIREVQIHPVKRTTVHVDFFAPNLRQEMTASVPVVFHHPNADAEGLLSSVRNEIEVRGLPMNFPHQIDADVSHLVHVGDALHVSDLTFPEGVSAVTDGDELLAHIVAERAAEEVEEVAEEAATGAATTEVADGNDE
jgi:large subunit ribosomal protein L25